MGFRATELLHRPIQEFKLPFVNDTIAVTMKRSLTLSLTGFFFLAGCVVPLKTPAVTGPVQQPTIDFGRLAEFATAAGHAYDAAAVIESAYGKNNVDRAREIPKTDGRYFIYFDQTNHDPDDFRPGNGPMKPTRGRTWSRLKCRT